MKTKPLYLNMGLLAIIGLALTALASQTRATVALSFSSWGPGNAVGVNETMGWTFSLAANVVVTQLGIFDQDPFSGGNGDGLMQPHIVTIWTSLGIAVAQVAIPAGSVASLTDGFRYVPLSTPILMTAGDYIIGAYYPNPSNDGCATITTGLTTASEVILGHSVTGVAEEVPTRSDGNPGYFGPNFQFEAVPEPSTMALLSLTLVALVKVWCRKSSR